MKAYLKKEFEDGEACASARAATQNHLAAQSGGLADTALSSEVSQVALVMEGMHRYQLGTTGGQSVGVVKACYNEKHQVITGITFDSESAEVLSNHRFPGDPEDPNRYGTLWYRGKSRNTEFTEAHMDEDAANKTIVCWLASETPTWKRLDIKFDQSTLPSSQWDLYNAEVTFFTIPVKEEPTNDLIWEKCQALNKQLYPICDYPNYSPEFDKDPARCVSVGYWSSYFANNEETYFGSNNPFKDTATYTGSWNGVHTMVPSGNSYRWSTSSDTTLSALCVLPRFKWKFQVKTYEFSWNLVRAQVYHDTNDYILRACKARGLVPLCGCDDVSTRDGKCLPLSMSTLRDASSECPWDKKTSADWNVGNNNWFGDPSQTSYGKYVNFYSGSSQTYGRGRYTYPSSEYYYPTICADVKIKFQNDYFEGEMVRVPIMGAPTGKNLHAACNNDIFKDGTTGFPVCDSGEPPADYVCMGVGNKKLWSEDTTGENNITRSELFESFFYNGNDQTLAVGIGPDGAIDPSTDADKYKHMSTWCMVNIKPRENTDKGGFEVPPATPKCNTPRDKWQKVAKVTTQKFCDARDMDLVIVINEAEYLSHAAVKPTYDGNGTVVSDKAYTVSQYMTDGCQETPENPEMGFACAAASGYQTLRLLVKDILMEFGNTCADGHVNRVAVVINTGNGAHPVRFPCTGEDGDLDIQGQSCNDPLTYLVADEIVAFDDLDVACETPQVAQTPPRVGLMGFGVDEEGDYQTVPICDAGSYEQKRDEAPCWMCRQYDKDTGEVIAVNFEQLRYRY
jgi:hypothetical protein